MAATKTKSSSSKKSSAGKNGSKGKKTSRCWAGYEPTPGKKPGAKGSCRKK